MASRPFPTAVSRADTGQPAIEATGLCKRYGSVEALADFDLRVSTGSVFSLLGPNGAGKTTAVRILATLTLPDAGRAFVGGCDVVGDPRAVRRLISVTGQYTAVDDMQTGEENLHMVGRLAGLSSREASRRTTELLERFDLVEVGRRRVSTYSGGTRRRLDLAGSLVRPPSVLFLDEPTTGLDVRGRHAVWAVIADLAASGVTIFLTTQYLEEADSVSDDIAIVDCGRVVAQGSASKLKRAVSAQRLDLVAHDRDAFDEVVRRLAADAIHVDIAKLSVSAPTDASASHVRRLLDAIDPDHSLVDRFNVVDTSLDDVFLALTSGRVNAGDGRGHLAPAAPTMPAAENLTDT